MSVSKKGVAFFYFDKIEHIPLLRHWGEGLLILVWLLWIVDCFGRWDNESKTEKYYRELLRGKGGVHINHRINKLKTK
tara:strand:- start:296 stop:529 length:234 start_codon:yes stop_codon:yes gene_type:complete